MCTSILRACHPMPLLTLPFALDNFSSSSLNGWSGGRVRHKMLFSLVDPASAVHPLAVSTYQPRPPLLRIIRQAPAPAPRLESSAIDNSMTRRLDGGGVTSSCCELTLKENGGEHNGRISCEWRATEDLRVEVLGSEPGRSPQSSSGEVLIIVKISTLEALSFMKLVIAFRGRVSIWERPRDRSFGWGLTISKSSSVIGALDTSK